MGETNQKRGNRMTQEEMEIVGISLIGVFGFLALYCAKKLIDEVDESMEEPPLGGWDEVYEKPRKEEPFEGWKVGE